MTSTERLKELALEKEIKRLGRAGEHSITALLDVVQFGASPESIVQARSELISELRSTSSQMEALKALRDEIEEQMRMNDELLAKGQNKFTTVRLIAGNNCMMPIRRKMDEIIEGSEIKKMEETTE
jgi:hypothetical protein